ncbi:hypothetical protein BZG36_04880 [Bifiguratus adelaidae]|uniref:Amino acid transporter transmembrane domain-containing protein n=1 Tax=Bifiguratus adelaidae TaxID=1938954 RepID=A0A261XVM5_9FUNG|nr:hypothetical protein BZG36_04880 [Bifiguratus adelaidae]
MASFAPDNMALEGGDPRESAVQYPLPYDEKYAADQAYASGIGEYVDFNTAQPSFAEQLRLAYIQRQREDANVKSGSSEDGSRRGIFSIFGRKETATEAQFASENDHVHPVTGWNISADHMKAQRALRVARWSSVFYLITTDILGPTSAPWAFSQLGYAPGVLLYFFLGVAAAYTGWQLWRMYLQLDSDEFPVKSYSDLAGRIFGKAGKHSVNVLQSIQLLFNVAVIVLGNGQGLSQIANAKVCFSVLVLIWALAGMIVGQIRSLQNFGWLANVAIWMNLSVIFATMGIVSYSGPNLVAAAAAGSDITQPVMTMAFVPNTLALQIIGVMQAVYSYGGAMLFVEFMSEMRRPMDFWKGMVCAQAVIFSCYMLYGAFVYSKQGQFTINPANQGIPNTWYAAQTALNAINLVSALIAAGLYGNIGIKIIYQTFVVQMFKGPQLLSKAGRFLWIFMVIAYWALAFVVASAIPQFSNISALVAAVCILQFTYTFPPLMMVGFTVKRDALLTQGFDPKTAGSGQDVQVSWTRGLLRHWYIKLFDFLFFLAAFATAILGIYSAVTGIIAGFQNSPAATSFGCGSPVA